MYLTSFRADTTPYLNPEEAAYYDMWLAQQGEQEQAGVDDDEFLNDGEEFFSYQEFVEGEVHYMENAPEVYYVRSLQVYGCLLPGSDGQPGEANAKHNDLWCPLPGTALLLVNRKLPVSALVNFTCFFPVK
jgi:hypothetical protein